METSRPLSIESFSYSWLVNIKPSLDSLDNSLRTSLDASDEASFIEMDPKKTPSKRFFRKSQDFKFDFPASPSPLGLVHADELISNGYLVPLFFDPLVYEAPSSDHHHHQHHHHQNLPMMTSSRSLKSGGLAGNSDCSKSLRRCRRMSKRILLKYLNFFRPLYRKIRGPNDSPTTSKSSGHIEKSVPVGKSRVYSSETASPRISVAYSADDYCWRKSCDSDSSIYEAVLHCKRSIGN